MIDPVSIRLKRWPIFIAAFLMGFAFYFVSADVNLGPAFDGGQSGSLRCDSTGSKHCYYDQLIPDPDPDTHQAYSGSYATTLEETFGGSSHLMVESCLTQYGWLAGNVANCLTTINQNVFSYAGSLPFSWSDTNNIGLGYLNDLNFLSVHIYVNNVYTNTTGTAYGRRVYINNFNVPSNKNVGDNFDIIWWVENSPWNGTFLSSGPISCNVTSNSPVGGSANCTATGSGTAQVEIQAFGPGGDGPITVNEIRSISIAASLVPGPFNLSGSCSVVNASDNRANLNWSSSANATGYTIQRKGWSGGLWSTIDVTAGLNYSDVVQNDTDFYYRVYAVNSIGQTISNPAELLVCNAGGGGAPTANISANPANISPGGSSTITWSSSNATSCTVSPPGWSGLSGSQSTGALSSTTTYTLNCSGPGGSASASATVTVAVAGAPTANISANPANISPGGSSTVTWSSSNATSCTVSPPGWSGLSGSQSTGALSSTTTYTLNCSGPGGSASASATVTVACMGNCAQYISQSVPGSVTTGQQFLATVTMKNIGTNTWYANPPDTAYKLGSLVGGNPWGGRLYLNNNETVPPGSSRTFTVDVIAPSPGIYDFQWQMIQENLGGFFGDITPNSPVNVTSAGAPTANISANPANISPGGSSTVTWSSSNATSCTVSPPGWSGLSGSQSTGALSSTTTYTLNCSGPGGSASASATVTVAVAGAPTVDIKANGSDGTITVPSGSNVTISWTSTNATTCSWGGGWPPSGSYLISNVTSGFSATMTCTGPGGTSAPDSVTINVAAVSAPTVDIKANGSDGTITVPSGSNVTISWTSTNATTCSWGGGWPPSGSYLISNVTSGFSATMTCTGPGGTSAPDSVTINVAAAPPVTSNVSVTVSNSNYCSVGIHATVDWNYSSAGSPPQSNQVAYEVQIDDDSDPFTGNPEWEQSGTIGTSVVTTPCNLANPATSPQTNCRMNWNTLYRAWVRVQNGYGEWSPWTLMSTYCNGSSCGPATSWTTPAHQLPNPDFSITPPNPALGIPVIFDDIPVTFDGGAIFGSWSWNFGDGSITNGTDSTIPLDVAGTTHTYVANGNYTVRLAVEDELGISCSNASLISIQKAIPRWREIAPR